jgi:CBS domain-containing protein
MESVQQVLDGKGRTVWSVGPEAMVHEALQLMAAKDVGALLVMEGGRLMGMLSERDYARKVFLKGRSSPTTRVREVMTERLVTVSPGQSIEECMALMTVHRVRHLPVLEGDAVVGLISIGDVVKASLAAKDFLIKQLENYITGDR